MRNCRDTTARAMLMALLISLSATSGEAQGHLESVDTWTVASSPSERYQLDGTGFIDIVDVVRLANGNVAIADRELSTITVFDGDGHAVVALGRRGEGPGEFQDIGNIMSDAAGALFVFDRGLQRLSQWTPDGQLVWDRSLVGMAMERPIGGVGRLRDGSWYVWDAERLVPARPNGITRDSVGYYLLEDREVGRALAVTSGMVSTQFVIDGRAGMRHVLLSPRSVALSVENCLLVGSSDIPVLRVVDPQGVEVGRVELEIQMRPATESLREDWVSATLERFGGDVVDEARLAVEAIGTRIPMADRIPYANDVKVDDLGYIWVQHYALPEGDGGRVWEVFNHAGENLGNITMPPSFRAVRIRGGSILGVWVDVMGEQEVRVYQLERGDSQAMEFMFESCQPR